MGIGCPDCRVIGGPHDEGCSNHPSAVAAREEGQDAIERLLAVLALDVEQGGLAHGTDEHKLWLRNRLVEIGQAFQ